MSEWRTCWRRPLRPAAAKVRDAYRLGFEVPGRVVLERAHVFEGLPTLRCGNMMGIDPVTSTENAGVYDTIV